MKTLAELTMRELLRNSLERKRAIDDRVLATNNMESYTRWLVDAVELLLQIELTQSEKK